jgi:hypothetical protein
MRWLRVSAANSRLEVAATPEGAFSCPGPDPEDPKILMTPPLGLSSWRRSPPVSAIAIPPPAARVPAGTAATPKGVVRPWPKKALRKVPAESNDWTRSLSVSAT